MRQLRTVQEIIDVFGGPTKTGRTVGVRVQNVVNWRAAGHIPPDYFWLFSQLLSEQSLSAPPSLFRQKQRPRNGGKK